MSEPMLALGCSTIGNHLRSFTDDQAAEVLTGAWRLGLRGFDTAPHYGLGLSERRLGRFLADLLTEVPRDQVLVTTKVGRLLVRQEAGGRLDDEDFLVPADHRRQPDFSAAGVRASLLSSLDRLGLERVDVAYVHDAERYDLEAGLTTAQEGLLALKDEGLVGAIGFASMDATALYEAADRGGWDELMVAGAHTLATDGTRILDRALAQGIAVAAAAVLNGGVLATGLRGDDLFDYVPITAEKKDRVQALEAACREYGVELAAAALQFPLRHPAVVRLVVGGASVDHIARNLDQLRAPIPDEFWRAVGA
ncbi:MULTISPECIES: aldo/keto reductase [Aestuariimicrobium]|uniref:aldo/keto reductase n=1 Tax=Aestuariimicrobium TaxID=396388 RepID=UPI0003FB947A|nr:MULTISPECIES: aldo/keto reductase [Aestuariimicrobium]CAI9409983.1 D-threo-aldose 1-dehydrogenase [Aestuariimicrobium sp. T2.26MG-19.2B]